jgi:iron complex outermembrane receptor protein
MKNKRLLLVLFTLLMGNMLLLAQVKRTITGVVNDNNGQPVPSATVSVKGTSQSVITDENGRYSITVEKSNPVLVFSSVSFTSRELAVGNSSTLDVSLVATAGDLGEVVVTSLGISKQKKALGYASSTIKAEDITLTGSPNFAGALYGKAPGVRIGATPGGATSAVNITIRGINSITGKNQPLIVLNGIPIRDGEVSNNNYWGDQRIRGNGLLDINPEDIDNISILKGASAAALYGSDAVNGVVLITTKNGKGKKGFSVDVNANYSQDKVAYLPRYQTVRGAGAPLNVNNAGQDENGFIYHDLDGDGIKETRGIPGFSINYGAKFDGKPTIAWDGIVRPYEAQKDRYAGLFQTANNSNMTVAVSQSSDNANMRFSLTRQSNQGVSLGAENTKNIANLNSTVRFGKKLTTDIVINYINQHTHNRPYSVDRMINNFTGMMGTFENGAMYLSKYKTSLGYYFVTDGNQSLTPDENIQRKYGRFKDDIADYVWRVKENNEDEFSDRVIGSLTNKLQIINNLSLQARIATDFTSARTESKSRSTIPLLYGYSGGFGLSESKNNLFYGDVLLTYNKKVSRDIDIAAMAGYTASTETGTYINRSTRDGLTVENWYDMAASKNPNAWQGSGRDYLTKDAIIGTVNATYKNYWFLEGTIRRDRTSTMNPNNNDFVYPSVNTSFIFTDAFQLPAFINYGKVRASWGIVGNYPDRFQANVLYNTGGLGSAITTTIPSSFGNELIRPEKKHEIEFGLEAKFLNSRISLEVSYYNAQVRDQILPLTIPNSSGAGSILTNIGTLRNKGLEVGIFGTAVKTKNFTWEAGINFASNHNVVEKLTNNSTELLHADFDGNAAQLKSVVGQPMGDFYAHPVATNDKGEKIVSSDGLYQLDANKMIKVGNAMPKAVGGLTNTFSFKGFTLDVLADFRFGGYVMPTGINWMISRGLLEQSLDHMDKEHGGLSYYVDANGAGVQTTTTQGPNGEKVYNDGMLLDGVTANGTKNTNVMSQAYYFWNVYNWGGPQYSSSRYELYIVKNSYIKMREMSLGYSLPGKIAGKIGAKKLQLSVFGRNLFYIYRTIKDMDAEQLTAGSRWAQTLTNAGTNPSTRSYGVMLRANF